MLPLVLIRTPMPPLLRLRLRLVCLCAHLRAAIWFHSQGERSRPVTELFRDFSLDLQLQDGVSGSTKSSQYTSVQDLVGQFFAVRVYSSWQRREHDCLCTDCLVVAASLYQLKAVCNHCIVRV